MTRSLRRQSIVCWLLVAGACTSSTIAPPRSPHVQVTWRGGRIAYLRDGHLFSPGLFGGGLRDAVQGVPAAEDAADRHRNRRLLWIGLLAGAMGCAAALLFPSAYFYSSSEAYRYDSITLFNEAVGRGAP